MIKTDLHLSIDRIAGTKTSSRGSKVARYVVSSITATLSFRTITSHMTSIATDSTDNVGGEVALLWAVVLPMTNLTTYNY